MTDTTQALMVVDAEPQAPATTAASSLPLFAWTDEDLQALRQTVAKDCNDSQFKVFVLACRRLGLDPFARQIVPIIQSDRMTPQVTIDGFRLISERTHKYAGMLGPYWCGKDGEWRDVWLEDGPPAAAKVGIRRRDFDEPTWGVCRYKSYAKGGNWNTMPDVMSAKVAEALARRITFPQELSGVYTEDEMDQARVDPAAIASAHPQPSRALPPPSASPVSRSQWDALKERMRSECRIENVGQFKAFTYSATKREMARNELPTLAEYDKLIAAVNRTSKQLRTVARTARPAAEPTPDELAEAQDDYEATQAADADETTAADA